MNASPKCSRFVALAKRMRVAIFANEKEGYEITFFDVTFTSRVYVFNKVTCAHPQ